MTIKLSLKLQTTRIQKQIPLSIFVFIESLVVSALQDSGGYAISRLRKTSSCIWVVITCWLSFFLHWYACADGRSIGRAVYDHVITKFSGMGRFT